MAAADEDDNEEIQEEPKMSTPTRRLMDFIPIYIPTVQGGLLDEAPREHRFLDFLRARPSRDWFLKFGFYGGLSPFSFLRRSPGESSGLSPPRPPSAAPSSARRRHFRVPFVRKINWDAMAMSAKEWVKNPMNMALLAWLAAVLACLVVMLLVACGALNGAIQEGSRRKKWVEVDNQILNALFTIFCLYEHPKLVHHLVLLARWKEKDVAEIRRVYSKKGAARPHERAHIAFVVALLHITCLSQYALCGLYWGYSREDRPDLGENLCIAVGIAAPVIAGVYTLCGPLARKLKEPATDEESQRRQKAAAPVDTRQAEKVAERVRNRRVVVTRPEWVGGLFDCWDDMAVAYLSFFCTFCVFGWNRERLGFGNMYVHIVTFLLVIVAPFWVFHVAALNIDDDVVHQAVGIAGIVLCVFGLLYGGFWRIQIRKRFRLPSNGFCCGQPNVTDCFQWLFCWACALAQEVRTGNFYDVEEDGFYRKGSLSPPSTEEEEGSYRPILLPLHQVRGSGPLVFPRLESPIRSYSCPAKLGAVTMAVHGGTAKVADRSAVLSKGEAAMEEGSVEVVVAAPVQPSIGRGGT